MGNLFIITDSSDQRKAAKLNEKVILAMEEGKMQWTKSEKKCKIARYP